MRSHIAVAFMLIATVGPALSVPIASAVVSLDVPSYTSTVAASGNDVDDSAATQLTMSLPVLSMLDSRTIRRRGEPTNFVLELHARGTRPSTLAPKEAASVRKALRMGIPFAELVRQENYPAVVKEVRQLVLFMVPTAKIQIMSGLTQRERKRLLQLMRGSAQWTDLSIVAPPPPKAPPKLIGTASTDITNSRGGGPAAQEALKITIPARKEGFAG
ncbi:hypothetical protein BC835DRAFT_775717 [Cytidiella melzeri]|nr:hypothetical protein BC835DRAFT_775717 [Cytidiella melzeri]